MAQFELNIYGENDEIVKRAETDHVRWGVFLQALDVQEHLKEKSAAEQLSIVNGFIKKIFPALSDEDIENADVDDIFSTFKQLINKARQIGGTAKNLTGAE